MSLFSSSAAVHYPSDFFDCDEFYKRKDGFGFPQSSQSSQQHQQHHYTFLPISSVGMTETTMKTAMTRRALSSVAALRSTNAVATRQRQQQQQRRPSTPPRGDSSPAGAAAQKQTQETRKTREAEEEETDTALTSGRIEATVSDRIGVDVFSGKGERFKRLNERYRRLCRVRWRQYKEADSYRHKLEVVGEIVDTVYEAGGRYLDQSGRPVDRPRAVKKTWSTLKDMRPISDRTACRVGGSKTKNSKSREAKREAVVRRGSDRGRGPASSSAVAEDEKKENVKDIAVIGVSKTKNSKTCDSKTCEAKIDAVRRGSDHGRGPALAASAAALAAAAAAENEKENVKDVAAMAQLRPEHDDSLSSSSASSNTKRTVACEMMTFVPLGELCPDRCSTSSDDESIEYINSNILNDSDSTSRRSKSPVSVFGCSAFSSPLRGAVPTPTITRTTAAADSRHVPRLQNEDSENLIGMPVPSTIGEGSCPSPVPVAASAATTTWDVAGDVVDGGSRMVIPSGNGDSSTDDEDHLNVAIDDGELSELLWQAFADVDLEHFDFASPLSA